MTYFTRRTLVKGGTAAAAAGALTGPALLDWAKAWAQSSQWKPEKGAQLSILRWKYFVQSEDDAFVALMDPSPRRRASRSRSRASRTKTCSRKPRSPPTRARAPICSGASIHCRTCSRRSASTFLMWLTISARNTAAGCQLRSPTAKAPATSRRPPRCARVDMPRAGADVASISASRVSISRATRSATWTGASPRAAASRAPKVFQEEREQGLLLVMDQNPGMRFGTRVRFKNVQAARAARCSRGWPRRGRRSHRRARIRRRHQQARSNPPAVAAVCCAFLRALRDWDAAAAFRAQRRIVGGPRRVRRLLRARHAHDPDDRRLQRRRRRPRSCCGNWPVAMRFRSCCCAMRSSSRAPPPALRAALGAARRVLDSMTPPCAAHGRSASPTRANACAGMPESAYASRSRRPRRSAPRAGAAARAHASFGRHGMNTRRRSRSARHSSAAAPSWWPPAPGWWLVALVLLAAIAAGSDALRQWRDVAGVAASR